MGVDLTNATNMANLLAVTREVSAAHKLEAGIGGSSSSSLGGDADYGEGLPPSQGEGSSSSLALLQVGAETASDQLPRQLQRAPSKVDLTNATNMANLLTVTRDVRAVAAHKLEAGTGGSSSSLGGNADYGGGFPPSQGPNMPNLLTVTRDVKAARKLEAGIA